MNNSSSRNIIHAPRSAYRAPPLSSMVMIAILAVAASLCLSCASSYQLSSTTSSFTGTSARARRHPYLGHSTLSMDMERPNTQEESKLLKRWNDVSFLRRTTSAIDGGDAQRRTTVAAVHHAATSHGMPWKTSVDESYNTESQGRRRRQERASPSSSCLQYMPFFEWQIRYMKENLTNLRPVPVVDRNGNDMSYAESSKNNGKTSMRMHTVQFASDEYKLIRMTSVDGGHQTQVFTSVWYPDPKYNLPILGVDLLQFGAGPGKKRTLCLMDFQSLHEQEENHDWTYEHLLSPIRNQYPGLHGEISSRFYDSSEFFSKQMLVGRCNDGKTSTSENDEARERRQRHESLIYDQMFPAFQQYMQTHVSLVKDSAAATRLGSREEDTARRIARVLKRHKEYDDYSSVRDPAKGLLAHHFGKDFAHSYVHDILFPLSSSSDESDD